MDWRDLLDLVFPRICAGCGGRVGAAAGHLCWDCQAQLPFVRQPYCLHCGDPVEGRVDEAFTCQWCDELNPAFDYARSVVRYRGPVQRIIQSFNDPAAHHLAPDLVRLLMAGLETAPEFGSFEAICCVPLHRVRQRQRGYNQSALLAQGLARILGKPFLRRALVRHRQTDTQTHLTARERVANVWEICCAAARWSPRTGRAGDDGSPIMALFGKKKLTTVKVRKREMPDGLLHLRFPVVHPAVSFTI